MENFGGILVILFFLFGGVIWRVIAAAGGAGVAAVTSGGDFNAHWRARAFGMGQFEIRTQRLEPDPNRTFEAIQVQARGLVPVHRRTHLAVVTSLLDCTEADSQPVLCKVDDFQEAETTAFQFSMKPTVVDENQGFVDWAHIGVILPDLLTPPRSGKRTIAVWVNLIDANNPPNITLGFVDNDGPQPIATYRQTFEWEFQGQGYAEAAEARNQLRPLYVRLAVAVAMADGAFGETEARTISKWIKRQLSVVSESWRERVKDACNEALRSSYAEAKSAAISFSEICDQIRAISEPADRYEAMELCLDVMAADGKAVASELELIGKVAEALELDYAELQRMKDQRMVGVTAHLSEDNADDSLEAFLGIDPDWSTERIREHLRDQFKTWNARLNNLKDQDERANVQARLDLISKARQKYAS